MWKINAVKKFILFALASFVIISCRKDDDEKEEPMIVGMWKTTDYIVISGKDGSLFVSNSIPATDCILKSNYIYKSNGKFIAEYFVNPQTGQCGNVGFRQEMDYYYNEPERKITFKNDGLTQDVFNIYSLSKAEMQILAYDKADYDADGTPDKLIKIYAKQ